VRLLPKNTIPRWIIYFVDVIGVSFAFITAYLVRFEFHPPHNEWALAVRFYPVLIAVFAVSFLIGKTYAGIIRYTGIQEAKRVFIVLTVASVLLMTMNVIRPLWSEDGLYFIPKSIIVLTYVFALFALLIFRAGVKWSYLVAVKDVKDEGRFVVLVGNGELARTAKRVMEENRQGQKKVVAWIDPTDQWKGNRLEGMIISGAQDWPLILQQFSPQEVILALEEGQRNERSYWIQRASESGVKLMEVPSSKDWIMGELSATPMREVSIEELLGRNEIQTDQAAVASWINGRVVLVTGAAGSIGSEIVRQLLFFKPAKVIVLDQAETPLFEFDNELNSDLCEFVIADVRKLDRMQRVFEAFHPSVVFHAAAYKHVPLMENNPSEAILTNVWGTKILADLSVQFGVEKFVMISTDKAVNPTNVMGASKRAAEIYVQSLNQRANTTFITTRFGNVLGSNGSVVKIFKKQIEQGGPLTVTHPEITRYFMTIPEAVQLVLQAGVMGNGGEIFVFDMGEKVKIVDLAKRMIQLSGYQYGVNMDIVFSGLRPGEKLYEEVLSAEEFTLPTRHEMIMIAKVRDYDWHEVEAWVNELTELFKEQNNELLVGKLKSFIPEYVSNNSEFERLDKKIKS
jgi:FlaA1/EpsC-like NDP-sugar epimerase